MNDFSALVNLKTDDELIQMFLYSHKYQPEMAAAAAAELNMRKIYISDIALEKKRMYEEEEARLSIGKTGSILYIVICLLLALFGGIVGIISGYIYAFSKTHSLSGKSFYAYDSQTRQYGRAIFWLGIAAGIYIVFLRQL